MSDKSERINELEAQVAERDARIEELHTLLKSAWVKQKDLEIDMDKMKASIKLCQQK